ncbi:hypothetical protein BVRB_5g109180 [Beta vulgaris subsp. vulgaris]|nr:hypothetical protein BVRB_5g109180 [Beta vulgaris subsp. vulgaris]
MIFCDNCFLSLIIHSQLIRFPSLSSLFLVSLNLYLNSPPFFSLISKQRRTSFLLM